MKRDLFFKRCKIFLIISGIFLVSRILIVNSILLVNIPIGAEFRWVSGASSIVLPYGVKSFFLKGSSPKKQMIGAYINNSFIKNIILDENPSFHYIEVGDAALREENEVEFHAESDFVPSQIDKGSGDNRKLSWMIYYVGTDADPRENLVAQDMRSEGFYGLERYTDIKSTLEKGLSKWDANWYVSIIEKGYEFNGDYTKQQNIVWPYIYPLVSRFIKELLKCSSLWAGIIVNNGMFFISLFVIYFLSRLLIANGITSYIPVLLLSFHPFNVFSASAFSEGLFIFCLSMSIIFLVKGKYLRFAAVGGALNGIRIVGIVAPFILLYHFFVIQKNRYSSLNLLKATALSLASLWGIFSQMLFLRLKFNDPFVGFRTTSAWVPEGGRRWSIFFGNLHHYVSNIFHVFDPEILGTTIGFFIIFYCIYYFLVRRRCLTATEHTFILYSLCLVLVTVISQKEIPPSIGRYTLACFPVLILLSYRLKNGPNIAVLLWLIFSVYSSTLLTMSFSKGLPPF